LRQFAIFKFRFRVEGLQALEEVKSNAAAEIEAASVFLLVCF